MKLWQVFLVFVIVPFIIIIDYLTESELIVTRVLWFRNELLLGILTFGSPLVASVYILIKNQTSEKKIAWWIISTLILLITIGLIYFLSNLDGIVGL